MSLNARGLSSSIYASCSYYLQYQSIYRIYLQCLSTTTLSPFQSIVSKSISIHHHPSIQPSVRLSFSTSTGLFVKQLVPSGTLALEADWSIRADVGAAAVVYQALIQPWRVEREERER